MIDNVRPNSRPKKTKPTSKLDRIDLELISIVKRHWFVFATFVAFSWILVGLYSMICPPTYESSASILLVPKDPSLAAKGVDVNTQETKVSDDLFAGHMMTIQSPKLIRTALEKNRLAELPSLVSSKKPTDFSTATYVMRNLYTTRGGDGQMRDAPVLTLKFRHRNLEDTQIVVQAIMDEFQRFLESKFKDVNKEAADIIVKAQSQMEASLTETRQKFETFQKETPILFSPDHSTNIYRAQYEQLQTALTSLRLERSEVAARLDMVEKQMAEINARAAADPEESKERDLERLALIDDKSAQRVGIFLDIFYSDAATAAFQEDQPARFAQARSQYEQLNTLKAKEKQLAQEFGPNHFEVRGVQSQIREIEKLLKEQAGDIKFNSEDAMVTPEKIVMGYIRLMRNDLAEFEMREKQLIEESTLAETSAKDLIQYELEGESLRLALNRQQDLYDATVERLRNINLSKDYGGFVIEKLDNNDIGQMSWPSLPLCVALGSILGFGFASIVVSGLEIRNRSLRTSKDIEAVADTHILSYIPKFISHRSRSLIKEIKDKGSNTAPIVFTVHDPKSQEAEVFRGLRTSLFFRANEVKAKVLAITSANSGDGKSTITANLVSSMAQTGKTVLIVECDMRKPAVAALLGIDSDTGLSDVLEKKIGFWDAIHTTETPGLAVLAAGETPESPAELLSSDTFRDFINEASAKYDYIVLDCPPVLAVSDPCIVAGVADGVIVVVRINPQSRVELQRTTGMLKDVQANLIGCIVNASSLEDDGATGKDGYVVGYGYGSYGDNTRDYYFPRGKGEERPVRTKARTK